jgi:hypothetical protein
MRSVWPVPGALFFLVKNARTSFFQFAQFHFDRNQSLQDVELRLIRHHFVNWFHSFT